MPTANATLRILHISDIHFRYESSPGKRAKFIEVETPRRAAVLSGEAWRTNLDQLLEDGPIDLVCLTGDVADHGKTEEFALATPFVDHLLSVLSLSRDRIFVVPGNHDVDRKTNKPIWKSVRDYPWPSADVLSHWIAGLDGPPGVRPNWRAKLCERQSRFWGWIRDLGRDELLPERPPHAHLGYRVDVGPRLGLAFPVWILGFDTAWLCGGDDDAGRIHMSEDQIRQLGTSSNGQPLSGLRLALGHHPLGELADGAQARRRLASHADLYLHGHQHDPLTSRTRDPDRGLLELAAGCLFEGAGRKHHENGFQVLTLDLDEGGRPRTIGLRFRSWSRKGDYWHDDASIYKKATGGRWRKAWPSAAESTPPTATIPDTIQEQHNEQEEHADEPETFPLGVLTEKIHAKLSDFGYQPCIISLDDNARHVRVGVISIAHSPAELQREVLLFAGENSDRGTS
ncbi:MAG: metallophosphoesterase [Nannocystis sp.]|nr:metallophosphoesterase [Nannocystis sp.]